MTPITRVLLLVMIAAIAALTAFAVLDRDREAIWASLSWPIKFTGENPLE